MKELIHFLGEPFNGDAPAFCREQKGGRTLFAENVTCSECLIKYRKEKSHEPQRGIQGISIKQGSV